MALSKEFQQPLGTASIPATQPRAAESQCRSTCANQRRISKRPFSLQDAPPTPHDLRRTLATGLARLRIPREDRLSVLGHAAADVHGRHYDKYERFREKRAALEVWEQHLRKVLGLERLETCVLNPSPTEHLKAVSKFGVSWRR